MGLPATTQDLLHGVDFTGLASQTAAEHNQLVDLSAPYTDGADDAQGIGLIINSSDTALNVPQVPDPTVAGYAKWKRYLWNRRSYGNTSIVGTLYQWNDNQTNDATLKKWVVIDPNAFLTISAAISSVTGTHTDTLLSWVTQAVVNASNAEAGTQANATDVNALATAVYGAVVNIPVGGTPLATTVGNIGTAQVADETMIGRINTQISGSSTDPTLNTGGMNQQIATNTTAITTNAAAAKLVANLTPGSLGQKMQVDVVAAVNTPVWYDPATDIYYTSASGTQSYGGAAQAVTLDIGINLPPGTWLVFAVLSGQFYFASAGATYAAYMSVVVGGSGTLVSPKTFVNNAGAGYCGALHLMQTITIPKASGNQTISVSVTTGSGTIVNTSGTFLNLLFKRVKLGV